ncbi:MAG: hypothetical protein NC213_09915 [Acetobacter sp.]|nr:hypothetical protein [Bacteroides sp.]MCM1342048.1 hypothetical protein [Acetobacter sp.]MCM1434266.1 hypothetical protein [Clostridiales bacterium]
MAKSAAEKNLATANSKLNALGSLKYKGNLDKQYNTDYNDYNNFYNNPEKYGYNAYITDVNELFDQVMNQKEFSYDPQKDKLFQMHKKQYNAQGNKAMQNQMGVAAVNSGGYNSSVAQTSAQSAFQGYMDALSEKASETYQNALDMYKYDQQNLLNRYNTARDMNNAGNEAYWKQLDSKQQKSDTSYNAWMDDKNFQYNQYSDNRNYWQTQGQNAQSQINWQKDYDQTEKWNKKNYNLGKKRYTGK